MAEKAIPERVLDQFISSLEGNKNFSNDQLKELRQLLEKGDQVTKKNIIDFLKKEVKQ